MKKTLLLFFLSLTLASAALNHSYAQAPSAPAVQEEGAEPSKAAPAPRKVRKVRKKAVKKVSAPAVDTAAGSPAADTAAYNPAPKASGRLSAAEPAVNIQKAKAAEFKRANSLLYGTMERLETLGALYDNLRLQVSEDTLKKITRLDKASNKVAAVYFNVDEPGPGQEAAKNYRELLNSALKSVKALRDVKDRVAQEDSEAAIGLCREMNAAVDAELAEAKLAVSSSEPPRQAEKPAAAKVAEPAAPVEAPTKETAAIAALSELRKAIEAYKTAEVKYPRHLAKLTPKYIQEIPKISVADHPATSEVMEIESSNYDEKLFQAITDTGKWLYFTDKESRYYGLVLIDCSHKDAQGVEIYKAGRPN